MPCLPTHKYFYEICRFNHRGSRWLYSVTVPCRGTCHVLSTSVWNFRTKAVGITDPLLLRLTVHLTLFPWRFWPITSKTIFQTLFIQMCWNTMSCAANFPDSCANPSFRPLLHLLHNSQMCLPLCLIFRT